MIVRIFPYPVKHHAAPDWGAGSRSGQRLGSGAVGSSEAFSALVQKELRKWAQVVKETGAKVE